MSTQITLNEYEREYEWATEKFTKTIIFQLAPPTARKRERLDDAIHSARECKAEAARRMPSVPEERWGNTFGTWGQWGKEMESHLSNNTVTQNVKAVRESFRSWQARGYDGDRPSVERFATHGGCWFKSDQPKYEIHNDRYYLSLPLAAGRGERERLPIKDGDYIRTFIDDIRSGGVTKGKGELRREDGRYQFHQVIQRDVNVLANPQTHVGVDVGLVNLAVVGAVRDGDRCGAELWSGSEAAEMRRRFHERKQAAQSDGEYETLRDDETQYIEHVCHTISREIIEWTLDRDRPAIVLEDLTDIRNTFIRRERDHTAGERRALHSWPFRKLQDMIEYKATEARVPVREIDPRNTSKRCADCGHEDDASRDGIHFECTACGYQVNADVNAAFNIGLG